MRTIWTLRVTEFRRVKKLISRERLRVQNRGREGEERPPCPPLFNFYYCQFMMVAAINVALLGRTFVKKKINK